MKVVLENGTKKKTTWAEKQEAEERKGKVEEKEGQKIRDLLSYDDDISTSEEATDTVIQKPGRTRRMISVAANLPLRVTRSSTKRI